MGTSTLDLSPLPLAGTLNAAATVAQVRDAWRATINYLDQVRVQRSVSYSVELGVQLDTVRYHAASALEVITRWEATGGTGAETATAVSGLAAPTGEFQAALAKTKAQWALEFGGGAGAAPATPLLTRLATPREPTWYVLWGGAALVLYLLTLRR